MNMKKKLMRTYILVISLTIIIVVLFSWQKTNQYFTETVKKDSETQSKLLTDILIHEDEAGDINFEEFAQKYSNITGVRITIIDMEGNVVIDSDEDFRVMENHAFRDEVSKALKGEVSSKKRFSQTLGTYYLYTALPLQLQSFDGVLRISVPLIQVRQIALDMLKYILIGIVIGAIVAIIIAYISTKKFMKPINELTNAAAEIAEGDFNKKIYINSGDQIGKLAETFNEMIEKLKINMSKLEQRNSELESILSSMINGIIAVDEDYKIFLYNDILTEILNIDGKEIEGKSIYEVIRNVDIFNVIEKSIVQEVHTIDETRISGIEDKVIRVYASPIISNKSNKKILGTLLVIQDVTNIRKLETMRSDFVSNVTHELKTPLTSIRGFVDTLKNGAIKDEKNANRFLSIIDIETERLSLLIGDILSLSEIENMKNDKHINENNVGEVIEEVVNILRPKVEKKNIELLSTIPEDLKPFKCNRNRIKQLLINLVDNAISYTDKGYVKISCKEKIHYLIIEIEDTGIGIEKKYIPRLFERFYRIDKGRSRKIGGTGLGLSIAKHIVELYNGTIKVESELGKGTRFIVKLERY